MTVTWQDGSETRHDAAWLREHSPAPDWRHPVTGERLFEGQYFEGPIAIKGAWLERDGAVAMILAPGGHQTRFEEWQLRPAGAVNTKGRAI